MHTVHKGRAGRSPPRLDSSLKSHRPTHPKLSPTVPTCSREGLWGEGVIRCHMALSLSHSRWRAVSSRWSERPTWRAWNDARHGHLRALGKARLQGETLTSSHGMMVGCNNACLSCECCRKCELDADSCAVRHRDFVIRPHQQVGCLRGGQSEVHASRANCCLCAHSELTIH